MTAAVAISLRPDEPWAGLLAAIAAEVRIDDDGPRIGGVPVPVPESGGELAALTAALYESYFLSPATPLGAWRWRALGRPRIRRAVVVGAHGPAPASEPRSRCYLHLQPAAAADLLARMAASLDEAGLPFTARLLLGVTARPDLGTVSVARGRIDVVTRLLLGPCRSAPAFGGPVPAFTLPLAHGVAVADEPDDGTDFGVHRCRAVASGLLAAGPGAGAGTRLAAVRKALTAAGVDPRAPHVAWPVGQKVVGWPVCDNGPEKTPTELSWRPCRNSVPLP